jgi:hypothetical protein
MANHELTVASGQRGIAVNQGRNVVDSGDTFVVTESEYESLADLIDDGVLIDEGTTTDEPTYGSNVGVVVGELVFGTKLDADEDPPVDALEGTIFFVRDA